MYWYRCGSFQSPLAPRAFLPRMNHKYKLVTWMWHLAMVAEARYKVQSFIVARGRSQAIKLFFFDMCVTHLQHASYILRKYVILCWSMFYVQQFGQLVHPQSSSYQGGWSFFCQHSAGRDGCAWIRLVAQSVELAKLHNPARCWGQFEEEVHALWPSLPELN